MKCEMFPNQKKMENSKIKPKCDFRAINTKREFHAVCDDFINFYYGDAEADFQQALVSTYQKYIVETKEQEMWNI